MDRCRCGQIFSIRCIDKKCASCCSNLDCKRHQNKFVCKDKNEVNKNEIHYDYADTEILDNINKVLDKTNLPSEMIDYILNYLDERLQCSMCNEKFHWSDAVYQCDDCGKIFCDDCNPNDGLYYKCGVIDCYFCGRGHCLNNRYEGRYCRDCIAQYSDSLRDCTSSYSSENETDSDDLEDDSDSDN